MATKKTTSTETSEAVETAEAKTFTIEALRKYCRKLFNVPTVVFAGATAELDATKKYTVAEMQNIIAEWCAKEVK